jgi:uncharacterized damage-inducible protein DinB
MNAAASIQLAPPGRGIPPAELIAGRLMFAFLRAFKTPEWATKHFQGEAGTMARAARDLPPQTANTQVLIPRIAGIEDSSRNWSVLMTLDHLAIVDRMITEIIDHLAGERLYIRSVAIAELKPMSQQTLETISNFTRASQRYVVHVSRIAKLQTATRHPHPWFGPLDAYGWHLLAAVHHTIHRRQIQRIIQYANQKPK